MGTQLVLDLPVPQLVEERPAAPPATDEQRAENDEQRELAYEAFGRPERPAAVPAQPELFAKAVR